MIYDIQLEPNLDSDNFLLTFKFGEQELTVPVGILLETNSAKRIQKTYSNFYSNYAKKLDSRKEEWSTMEEEYEEYLNTFQIRPLRADYITKNSDSMQINKIYVVDLTFRVVYPFSVPEDVYYLTTSVTSVIISDENGKMSAVTSEEFLNAEEVNRRKQLVFDLTEYEGMSLGEIIQLTQ